MARFEMLRLKTARAGWRYLPRVFLTSSQICHTRKIMTSGVSAAAACPGFSCIPGPTWKL
jgi:hypothetical protein